MAEMDQAGAAPLALDQTELFSGMRPEVLHRIAERMTGGAYREGVIVAKEGTPGDCLFVIGQGTVEIVSGLGTPQEKRLNTVGAGGFFGEMSLIENREARGAAPVPDDLGQYRPRPVAPASGNGRIVRRAVVLTAGGGWHDG